MGKSVNFVKSLTMKYEMGYVITQGESCVVVF